MINCNESNIVGKTVLLVEDDEVSAELLGVFLADTGINLLVATNKEEAYHLLTENQSIDLVFTDMVLPNGSGMDILQKVKQIGEDIPVIAQTGLGSSSDRENALKMGFKEYLLKPIHKKQLIDTLTSYLSAS